MASTPCHEGWSPHRAKLLSLYDQLLATYGPQHWWPGDSPFEIMVGAVLTQNAAWVNVEKAIDALKQADALDGKAILALSPNELAEHLRPSGYFNVKAKRLRALCEWLIAQEGIAALAKRETNELREQMLSAHGIGPETADDILLYAFERPVFVIDAYTRRLLSRVGLARGDEPYEALRTGFEAALPTEVPLLNEYHALIVRHAKVSCRVRPRCAECCLRGICPSSDCD